MPVQGLASATAALSALEAIARLQPVGVAELSRHLNLSKSTTQRILVTLASAGWIRPAASEVKRWQLTSRALSVGQAFLPDRRLHESLLPLLTEVRDLTGETVHVSVPDGDVIVNVDVLEAAHQVRVNVRPGGTAPLWTSAAGLAICARMPRDELDRLLQRVDDDAREIRRTAIEQARRNGLGLSLGDVNPGVHAVAAALSLGRGLPLAAVVVSAPAERMPEAVALRHGHIILAAVRDFDVR